jgi:NhaP-type Na+/H+ or K+/H+ antiporter
MASLVRRRALRAFLLSLVLSLVYGALYCLAASVDEAAALLPGGMIFSFLVLFVLAVLCGDLVARYLALPALLGMLLLGLVLANIPGWSLAEDIPPAYSRTLRIAALAIILLRAGLGLDLRAIRVLGWPTMALTVLPASMEALTVALLGAALFGLPPLWAGMFGFLISAVSPAVVVPSLLALAEQGYGVEAGIPSMLLAAAGLEDVYCITAFGIFFGLIFSEDKDEHPALTYLHAPIELVLGIGGGFVVGYCVHLALRAKRWLRWQRYKRHYHRWLGHYERAVAPPQRLPPSSTTAGPAEHTSVHAAESNTAGPLKDDILLTCVLMGLAIVCVLGADLVNYPGAGPLAVMVMGATVAQYCKPCTSGASVVAPPRGTQPEPVNPDPFVLAQYAVDLDISLPPPPSAPLREPSAALLPVVAACLKRIWAVAQPILFSLIGIAVDLSVIEGSLVGYGVLILLVSLTVRWLAAFGSASLPKRSAQRSPQRSTQSATQHSSQRSSDAGDQAAPAVSSQLTLLERLFVGMAWLPKATVQAALSSAALDEVIRRGLGEEDEDRARILLTTGVLSILLTAPPGALLISKLGPRWLRRKDDPEPAAAKEQNGNCDTAALSPIQVSVV